MIQLKEYLVGEIWLSFPHPMFWWVGDVEDLKLIMFRSLLADEDFLLDQQLLLGNSQKFVSIFPEIFVGMKRES